MVWLETDNSAISVQLNLTGTATGTELGNKYGSHIYSTKPPRKNKISGVFALFLSFQKMENSRQAKGNTATCANNMFRFHLKLLLSTLTETGIRSKMFSLESFWV